MPKFHNDATLPIPLFPGSHMVIDDNYVFLSGMSAEDIQSGESIIGNVAEETRLVMRSIQRMLTSVGCDLCDVVRVDVYLTDLELIRDMDAAYAEFFDSRRYPARTCTQSPRLYGSAHVEITVMASRPAEAEKKEAENEEGENEKPEDEEREEKKGEEEASDSPDN
ncbi:RidA family protein [Halomonas daqiaonensis]|uniref:2-iminobutanoate/2-iminopropanoate deaminase n=1 Tax=Halomonas daqiaonensis TaxID=650850 RepID=A0A1H7VGS7_9GAMM|nr:2-iminobutanoate/2-iminopropanoate deaminase [Halomonas daqiaonensis]